jgi:hypothetical protein
MIESTGKEEGTMFWLKACPRCCGDLTEQVDAFGRYARCVVCDFTYVGCTSVGYILTDVEITAVLERTLKQTTEQRELVAV